jgi:hypothetical protein
MVEVSEMGRAANVGGIAAVVGAIPVAFLCALVYRFPIPFSGYESGPGAAMRSLFAALMYGVFMGGFVVLGVLGAGFGALASRLLKGAPASSQNPTRQNTKIGLLVGLGVAVIVVGLLANWDYIYGPW